MVAYEWDDAHCQRYADGLRPMVQHDHRRWAQRISGELAGLSAGCTLVDVATGPGFLLVEIGKLVPNLDLVALDQAEPMLAIARQEAQAAGLSVKTVACPAESLALDDGVAEVVTCKQLLHEARDAKQVLAEALRILKPEGRLFLIDFDADGSWLAAFAIRTFIRVSCSADLARDYWKSFKAGLPGAEVKAMLTEVGYASVDYQRSGPNYLIIGSKPS